MNGKVCSICKVKKKSDEFTPRADRPGKVMSACKLCRSQTRKLKAPRSRLIHANKQSCLYYHKSKRNNRTKNAFICKADEFNLFVLEECQHLRNLRTQLTGLQWHIDHIVPLQNSKVCGLHVWTNLQIIPAIVNWRKNNAFYD